MSATHPAPGLLYPDNIPADLAERFAQILDLLRRIAAAHLASNRAATPVLLLFWARMHRLSSRFASLVERIRTGTLRPPRAPTPGRTAPNPAAIRPAAIRPAAAPKPPLTHLASHLPRRFAWLIRLVPPAAVSGSQLQHLLSQPEVVALLEGEPRFGRMLRPLCRMLGLAPPPLPSPARLPGPPPAPPRSESASPGSRPAGTPAHHQDAAGEPPRVMAAGPPRLSTPV